MSLYCGHADIDSVGSSSSIERAADKFAADLILPNYLLIPYLEKYKTIGSKEITQISDLFDVSYTAVARKLIECRHLPACLVCYNQHGRKWFKRSIDLPDSLRLKSEIDYRSTALGLLFNKTNATNLSALIAADAWFAHREAYQFIVREDCIKITPEEVLVLITVTDKKMMSLS